MVWRQLINQIHRYFSITSNTRFSYNSANAPDLDKRQFTAMTRLDHNRALGQLANKTNRLVADITRMTIWGNHSMTQYPDLGNCLVKGVPALELVTRDWAIDHFIPPLTAMESEAKAVSPR
ncbi:MAG: hypothetical protein G8D59_14005 [gamma proteobacterium symbiont of Phacoides pectinatus]